MERYLDCSEMNGRDIISAIMGESATDRISGTIIQKRDKNFEYYKVFEMVYKVIRPQERWARYLVTKTIRFLKNTKIDSLKVKSAYQEILKEIELDEEYRTMFWHDVKINEKVTNIIEKNPFFNIRVNTQNSGVTVTIWNLTEIQATALLNFANQLGNPTIQVLANL